MDQPDGSGMSELTLWNELVRLRERIDELEARAATWTTKYKLPADAIPPRFPPSEYGTVMTIPLVIEDSNYSDPDLRALMSVRLEPGQWREGPASQGWRYWGGNPKSWLPGGVMISAISDTVDIMGAMIPVDPVTGEVQALPTKGTTILRIYDSYWYHNEHGKWAISARTAEIQILRNGIRMVVTKNEKDHPPIACQQWNEPENLNSGRTGWYMGFNDGRTNSETGLAEPSLRMVHLARLNSMVQNPQPEFAGMYVMYINPQEVF